MNTKKLWSYFFCMTSVLLFLFFLSSYLFLQERNKASDRVIDSFKSNSTHLIVDRIYEDLIMDNFIEAERKLGLLTQSKIINSYRIFKAKQVKEASYDKCELLYFSKIEKSAIWGTVCISFTENFKKQNSIDFYRISFSLIFLGVFILLIIFTMFKLVKNLNQSLYSGMSAILNNKQDKMNFEGFWEPVFRELQILVKNNKQAEEIILTQKIEKEIVQVASQVSHDIRSPLVVLENLNLSNIVNTNDRINAGEAIRRLNEIANTLLSKNRLSNIKKINHTSIQEIIENTIINKKIEFPNHSISLNANLLPFEIYLDPISFESIISNILNNAIEASRAEEEVDLSISVEKNELILVINDNGQGIPVEVLSDLGKKALTFNKQKGNGFGVFYAFEEVKKWNGKINISSKIGNGALALFNLGFYNLILTTGHPPEKFKDLTFLKSIISKSPPF